MLDFVYLAGSLCFPYKGVGVKLSQLGVCDMSLYSGESIFMTQRIICSTESLFDMVGEVFFHVFFKFWNSKTSVKSLHFE